MCVCGSSLSRPGDGLSATLQAPRAHTWRRAPVHTVPGPLLAWQPTAHPPAHLERPEVCLGPPFQPKPVEGAKWPPQDVNSTHTGRSTAFQHRLFNGEAAGKTTHYSTRLNGRSQRYTTSSCVEYESNLEVMCEGPYSPNDVF